SGTKPSLIEERRQRPRYAENRFFDTAAQEGARASPFYIDWLRDHEPGFAITSASSSIVPAPSRARPSPTQSWHSSRGLKPVPSESLCLSPMMVSSPPTQLVTR